MGEYRYRENVKRGMAFVLAIILGGMAFLPGFPVFPAKAAPASGQQTTLTTAHGDTLLGHKLYCIDKGGYAIWGIAEKGDLYEAGIRMWMETHIISGRKWMEHRGVC